MIEECTTIIFYNSGEYDIRQNYECFLGFLVGFYIITSGQERSEIMFFLFLKKLLQLPLGQSGFAYLFMLTKIIILLSLKSVGLTSEIV